MAGIKDYSTTAASNTSVGGISIAEGMLPSNINNALRAIPADIREWYNDAQWIEYGDGDGSYTATYVSGTSFTISGTDVTGVYHANRRIKLTASTPGTIYGTISSSSFSTNTTVVVSWDSGSLSNESINNVYVAALSATNNSLPENSISSDNLKSNSVTTAKITDANVTAAKLASGSVEAAKIGTNAVVEAKINAGAVSTTKLADNAVITAKITDANITTAKIADSAVTTAKINADAIDGTKIANDAIDSEHYTDGSIDTAHIADSQITSAKIADSGVTTAKINDDAVTAAKIADAVIVTNSEHSAHTPDDTTFFTTSASDGRYFRQDSSETISSGNTWSASDSYIATTSAIDNRIIDLVDDVGGFVAIANETSFPSANPDVNNGTGTIVSIKEISTTRTPSSGTVTIANGQGSNTVTINGCGSTVLTAGFGVLVETTSTLNTYTFHRLQPKATEITTVASISSDITTVSNNDSNITAVAGDATDIGTVAGQISPTNNISTLAGISSDITTVAGDTTNIGTVAGATTNINLVAGQISPTNNISTVASANANITTVANNISGVNSFGERYRVSSSAPTTSLDVGDLYYDTTADAMKVYGSSGWQNAGSSVNGTSARFTYTISGTPTTVTGTDDNGETLSYDAGFIDVYLNGVKQVNGTDVTVTSGTSIVFASALAAGDIVDCIAFGTFSVSSLNASNLTSGTVNNARLPSTISDKTIEATALTAKGDGSSADGKITLNCSQNSHGVAIQSPAHSAGQSYTLILPTSVGTNGQVLATNGNSTNQLTWVNAQETKPTVADVSQTIAPSTATTITITGTNFVSIPIVEFIKTDGSVTIANTVSFTNSTTLSVNVTLALGNYYVRIENPDGNAGRSTNNILTASTAPSFTTAAGTLGTIAGNFSGTVATVAGSSDSAITFSETTSVLTNASQANCSLNSSTGVITTTDFGGSSTTPTTYNFTIRITDAEGQTADRNFSLTSSFGATGGGQFN